MTAYDVIGVVLVFTMVGLLLRRAARNLGMLARLEPPNVVKD
jgi:hypothetical protein